jgi:polyhydroxyalkanoate synthesis regulator phasin
MMAKLSITPKQWEDMDDQGRARHIHKISKAMDDLTWQIEQFERKVRDLESKLRKLR